MSRWSHTPDYRKTHETSDDADQAQWANMNAAYRADQFGQTREAAAFREAADDDAVQYGRLRRTGR